MRWVVLILFAAVSMHGAWAANLNKCVDEKGKTYYYDKLPPPECKDKEITEMTSKGVVTKKIEAAPTPEQRKAREEELARKKEEAQKLRDQQRRDQALLATYANETEIDLARERNLQQTSLVIQSIEPRVKSVQAKLDGYRKQADSFTKANKPVPEPLQEDIAATEKELKKLRDEMAQKQQEKETIRAKFEADKKRYRELTQKRP